MRKVALITDGWRRLFTYAWPAGILQRIKETNEEVNLYIFNLDTDSFLLTGGDFGVESSVISIAAFNLLEGYGNDNPGANAHVR